MHEKKISGITRSLLRVYPLTQIKRKSNLALKHQKKD